MVKTREREDGRGSHGMPKREGASGVQGRPALSAARIRRVTHYLWSLLLEICKLSTFLGTYYIIVVYHTMSRCTTPLIRLPSSSPRTNEIHVFICVALIPTSLVVSFQTGHHRMSFSPENLPANGDFSPSHTCPCFVLENFFGGELQN